VCSLFFTLVQPAAAALGMKVTQIKAGLAADSVAAAFNTVVQAKYDGVFVPAIQPSLWQHGLDQLVQAKIPVVTTGVVGGDTSKIAAAQVSDKAIQLAGKLLAAFVVKDTGAKTDVVFYSTPEIAFNPVLADAFQREMKTLCPQCHSRTAKVPAATMGTSAPSLIVDDLQANPKTTTAVFGEADQAAALPAALKVAGITVKTLATFPDPQSLQQVKSGQVDAALGVDLPVDAWTLMDSLARLTTGGTVPAGAKADAPPMQILTAADLPGDVSHGWTGYPDFAARFTALWKNAG
jgi:ribose transport system substrate-binding protein